LHSHSICAGHSASYFASTSCPSHIALAGCRGLSLFNRYGTETQRFGYGWIWAGPQYPCALAQELPKPAEQSATKAPSANDFDRFVQEAAAAEHDVERVARQQWDVASSYAAPDLRLILFRLIALTATAGALLVAVSVFSRAVAR
jgi:hypothetical protein